MAEPGLPPFSSVLKSREVEDPVNLWVHRPLAYGFVVAVYRTPITPNQVTLLAILLGLGAAGCWIAGTPTAMVVGGALLWSSAIMDGADGILARAKQMSSEFGRALDGFADMIVGLATTAAAIYHMWDQDPGWSVLVLGLAATAFTGFHLNLYDVYKELYLRYTRSHGGESHQSGYVAQVNETERVRTAPWYTRLSMRMYADYLAKQESLTQRTNPAGARLLMERPEEDDPVERAALYRKHNRWPMQLWMVISLAPHSYLFAIFGMFDALPQYLWLRLTLMNVVAVLALVAQRRGSRATLQAYTGRAWMPAAAPLRNG